MNKVSFFTLLFLTACASRPRLYPNDKYKEAGKTAAKADVDQCIAEAKVYLKSTKGKQVVKGAGAGAAIGAAIGGVGGLFSGDVGGGLVRGGAIGAAAGGTAGAVSPDELKQRYVNQCLSEKGYQVIGWD